MDRQVGWPTPVRLSADREYSCWSHWFRVSLRLVTILKAAAESTMHIVAIGWLYVVLMMSISETSVVAGLLTMFFYGLLPVAIILYISGSTQRKKQRAE